MKKFKLIIILLLSLFINNEIFACKACGCSTKKETHSHSDKAVTKEVNTSKSSVKWLAKKVTGSHEGNVKIKDAHLHFEDGLLSGGTVIMDMQSIVCTDLDGELKEQLEGHLLSEDFFGSSYYPEAKMEILKAQKKSKDLYSINAVISIKGIKQNISFDATIKNGLATANLVIDRTKFNIKYGSGSFFDNLGDNLIYDDFNLTVQIAYR